MSNKIELGSNIDNRVNNRNGKKSDERVRNKLEGMLVLKE